MIKRSDRLAFMEVVDGEEVVYKRLTGFTEFSISKNPKEYSRKYIDEDMERSEVVAYSTAVSYKFDAELGNPVHEFLAQVAEEERLGEDALCKVIIVDINKYNGSGASAIMRRFTVIPQNEGDNPDTYTVSGTLKAVGDRIVGTAKTTDNWQTATFEAN
ncbi:MAG: hypothetical protein IJ304_01525 [Clostridia bacterium]|nr:hypothetical protein [Clostridia bacterium]